MTDDTPDDITTRTATEWLVRLQSPQLTAAQRRAFFAWLRQRPQHQRAYIDAERHWQRLAALENLPPATQAGAAAAAVSWYRRPAAIAATFAGFVLILALQLWSDIDGVRYQTETGQQQRVKLADGSRLHLNTDSSLAVKLQRQQRLVVLQKGEVFFDISPDQERPFVVQMPLGSVRVLGTRFTVRSSDTASVITVIEGRVGVSRHGDSAAVDIDKLVAADFQPEALLTGDQQLTLAAGAGSVRLQQVDAAAAASWREGRQVYNGERFAAVVADLSRYFSGEIRLGNESLEDIEVVAVIDVRRKDRAIAALESAFNVVAVEKAADLVVLYPHSGD